MGKQLNLIPSTLNNIWLLQPVQWDIIEYQVSNTDDIENTEPQTTYKTRLATPTYISQLSNRSIQNDIYIEEQKQIYSKKGYYAYILYNKINILTDIDLQYYNAEDLTKFIGPMESISQLVNILQKYAEAHNVQLHAVSENQYELI